MEATSLTSWLLPTSSHHQLSRLEGHRAWVSQLMRTLGAFLWEASSTRQHRGFPSHPECLCLHGFSFAHRKKGVTATVARLNSNFSESPRIQNSPGQITSSTLRDKDKRPRFLHLTRCTESLFGVESYVDTTTWIEEFTCGGEKLAAQGNKVWKMQMQVLGGTRWPAHSPSIQWSHQGNWLQKHTWTSRLCAEESIIRVHHHDIKTPLLRSKMHKGS